MVNSMNSCLKSLGLSGESSLNTPSASIASRHPAVLVPRALGENQCPSLILCYRAAVVAVLVQGRRQAMLFG